jgi:RNA polymerase sigma factor (sigma-70 family)
MPTEDQEVVAGFLRGESDAVGTVDDWIARAAWPYQRRLANRWDDVLQDVRLEVTRLLSQGKFRGESSLKTYLWRVVSHTCLDQIRSQSKWQWADLDTLEQGEEPAGGAARAEPTEREDRDLLMRVLARSSQDCRDLWRMVLAGLSYREMSLRTGVAEGTLRVRVLRCREKAVAMRRELTGLPGSGRNRSVTASPNASGEAKADEL